MTPSVTESKSYSARNESIKLSLLLTCLCLSILYGDWTWRWDRLIYDAQSGFIEQQANNDIVIIAIDENSLSSIGRWPWPRRIHAQLINKLTEYQAQAVLVDMIFSEPSFDKHDDQLLSEAIKKNGKVVLPVLLEQTRIQGQLLETLPLPIFTQAAADIGHVHIELDPDGIARGTYLYEGLGEARWPHIGLSLLRMIGQNQDKYTKPNDSVSDEINSQWTWIRRQHFLIPYIGPHGSFKTTSYTNVLNNEVSPEAFKNKIVLIGVTAAGLGDSLPTPVSGLARAMPGIEINANIVQAIESDSLIKVVSREAHYIIAALLVMLPILLFPYLSPRLTLILVLGEICLILISSLFLLKWLHVWIPLSSTLICLVLSYPLWAWRRLEFTVKYLNKELETLSREASEIERYVAQDNEQSFKSLQKMIPISGISILNDKNMPIFKLGKACNNIHTKQLLEHNWTKLSDNIYAMSLPVDNEMYKAYIYWNADASVTETSKNESLTNESPPNKSQSKIIKTYIRNQIKPQPLQAKTTVEIIESRINDIQATTDKLTYLRQFITDSLEQMADGVIVVDSLGTVTLANKQAVKQISNIHDTPLLHHPIQPVLERFTLSTGESWNTIIDDLLSNKHYDNLQVRTQKNKDLAVNISPLYKANSKIVGFIINLSDITEIKNAQRRRDEMLSFLSHDLRSPLVSILAMLEQTSNHDQLPLIKGRIEKNINQTIKLAEDFVHLSRIESNDDIKFHPVNLSDVIANAVDTVWDQANIKNIQLKQKINCEGWISGNGAILERVIINLLTNAIKFSHEKCLVTIKLTEENSNIIFCIQDNGPGIAQESIPLLFDRFERAQQFKDSGKAPGIGLGLAFVHAAIERHGGAIKVQSELDKGTSFCITLPEYVEREQ